MVFQCIEPRGSYRDRGFHFMGNIVNEVGLYLVNPFLFPDGFVYKYECDIAYEQDQCKGKKGPPKIITDKVPILFNLGKDRNAGIVRGTRGIGGVSIFFTS